MIGSKQVQSQVVKSLDGIVRWRQREEERFEKEELALVMASNMLNLCCE